MFLTNKYDFGARAYLTYISSASIDYNAVKMR